MEMATASPGPSAALSAPLFLSPQWGRGRVCQQRGQFPSGYPVPAAAPQVPGGMDHFPTGSRKRPPWVSRQKSFVGFGASSPGWPK